MSRFSAISSQPAIHFNTALKASNLALKVKWTEKTHGWCSPCFCSDEKKQETEDHCDTFPLHPLIKDGHNVDLDYDEFTGEVCLTQIELNAIAHLVEARPSNIISACVLRRIPAPVYARS